MNKQELLEKLLSSVQGEVILPAFQLWFSHLSVESLDHENRTVVLGAADPLKATWLDKNYPGFLAAKIKSTMGDVDYNVSLVVRQPKKQIGDPRW